MLYREDAEVIPVQKRSASFTSVLSKKIQALEERLIGRIHFAQNRNEAVRETDTFDTFLSHLGIFCATVILA